MYDTQHTRVIEGNATFRRQTIGTSAYESLSIQTLLGRTDIVLTGITIRNGATWDDPEASPSLLRLALETPYTATAATGSIVVAADISGITAADTLTVGDGVHAAVVFAHYDGDGSESDATQIDIGDTPTAAELAGRIADAINAANTANTCDIVAVADGTTVTLTNAVSSEVGNVAMTSTASEYTLTGMSGGLTADSNTTDLYPELDGVSLTFPPQDYRRDVKVKAINASAEALIIYRWEVKGGQG